MQFVAAENALLSVTLNPLLKTIIGRFDEECPECGGLLLNSLRYFLGENVSLCSRCREISHKAAFPVYELGSRFLHTDREFMHSKFLDKRYGQSWFKGFGLMMKGVKKYGIRFPFTPAGPFEIVWNVTYQCNLRCKHCYEDAGTRERIELSTDEAKQVIDKLSKLAGVGLPALSFSGGEPLARRDFFELAAYAKKRVGYVSIASNGTLLSKDNAEAIRAIGVDYVEISLDGASPQVHNEFRGITHAFDRTMDGIKNCVDAGVDTCIATVMHRNNLGELDKLIGLSKELGTRFMHFNYIPTGRAKANVQLDLTPDERFSVLETLGKEIMSGYLKQKEEEMRFGKSSLRSDKFFSPCPQYASVTRDLSHKHGADFMVEAHYAAQQGVERVADFLGGCGAGRLYCCMEPNGDLKPCVFFPTNSQTVLGNVLRGDFEEIWDNNPLLWQIRSRELL
jgi:MoaA/NifB/PqqE/SkfB family radical SAM enzyme